MSSGSFCVVQKFSLPETEVVCRFGLAGIFKNCFISLTIMGSVAFSPVMKSVTIFLWIF